MAGFYSISSIILEPPMLHTEGGTESQDVIQSLAMLRLHKEKSDLINTIRACTQYARLLDKLLDIASDSLLCNIVEGEMMEK